MATEHGDRDDSRVHTTGADENGSEEHVKSGRIGHLTELDRGAVNVKSSHRA